MIRLIVSPCVGFLVAWFCFAGLANGMSLVLALETKHAMFNALDWFPHIYQMLAASLISAYLGGSVAAVFGGGHGRRVGAIVGLLCLARWFWPSPAQMVEILTMPDLPTEARLVYIAQFLLLVPAAYLGGIHGAKSGELNGAILRKTWTIAGVPIWHLPWVGVAMWYGLYHLQVSISYGLHWYVISTVAERFTHKFISHVFVFGCLSSAICIYVGMQSGLRLVAGIDRKDSTTDFWKSAVTAFVGMPAIGAAIRYGLAQLNQWLIS